jgi:cysteine-rich repeat protein
MVRCGNDMSRWAGLFAVALVITAWGCGDDDSGSNKGKDSGADEGGSGATGGSSGKGGSGGGGSGGSSSTGKPDGSVGGSGGSGGSGEVKDAGPDTSVPDPCAGLADACLVAGTSCDGSKLVTCEKNADGCLVATTTECAEGDTDYCAPGRRNTPAACGACDETDCTEASIACDGDNLVTCGVDANGCLAKTTTDCTAGSNDYCDSNATPDRCAACPNSGCSEAGTSCDGKNLVTCSENANGCLVRTVLDCTTQDDDVNTCSVAGGTAACIRDVCRNADGTAKSDVCVVDETQCAENVLVTCDDDGDGPGGVGCKIRHLTPCSTVADPDRQGENFNYCNAQANECAFDRCLEVADPCEHEGKRCDGKNIISCESDLDPNQPCLVEKPVACGANDMCDDPDGPAGSGNTNMDAQCVACTDAPGCTAEGFKECNGNVFETCQDTDGNGCLELITEDCGPTTGATAKFTCDEDARCKYTAPTDCDEALDANHVIRESGTLQGFNTAGAVNDYGTGSASSPAPRVAAGYVCPGLDPMYPFLAAAKDILFALEVPAHYAVDVAFANKSAFSDTGAWMLLLPDCNDSGTTAIETRCEAYSDTHLSFANEGDTTARKYLVVDADGNTNVGTFDLVVTTRALDCGDGHKDGSEQCDDGNLVNNDGCKSDCTLETNYLCTQSDPTVCTRHPPDDVCGNVKCAALPTTPAGIDTCCTTGQKCGLSYAPLFGNSCIERQASATADNECPNVPNMFGFPLTLFAPTISGCCRADHTCGLLAAAGGGCIANEDAWTAMLDGAARVYYDGPFTTNTSCTP